jgi:predicted Na+-dependent transporter
MLLAALLGLLVPPITFSAAPWISALLCVILFFALFHLHVPRIPQTHLKVCIGFTLARYLVLPLLLWGLAQLLLPSYSAAVLLLALMPGSVTSPAFTGMLRGNIPLAASITALSSLVCIAAVPFLAPLLDVGPLKVQSNALIISLLIVFGLPSALYFTLRSNPAVRQVALVHGQTISVAAVSGTIFLAVWQQQPHIFISLEESIAHLAVLCVLYLVFFGLGRLYSRSASPEVQTALVCVSGFNNNGLAVALAALHMPHVLAFVVLSELPWSAGYWVAQRMMGSSKPAKTAAVYEGQPES